MSYPMEPSIVDYYRDYPLNVDVIKNMNEESKVKIVEALWNIIYSDSKADMYENSLMRRLTGLIYLDPKIVGDIKKKMINNL